MLLIDPVSIIGSVQIITTDTQSSYRECKRQVCSCWKKVEWQACQFKINWKKFEQIVTTLLCQQRWSQPSFWPKTMTQAYTGNIPFIVLWFYTKRLSSRARQNTVVHRNHVSNPGTLVISVMWIISSPSLQIFELRTHRNVLQQLWDFLRHPCRF